MFTCNSMFRLHALQDYLKSCRYFRRQYFAWESICLNSAHNFFFCPLSLSFLQFVFPLSLLSSCLVVRSLRYVLLILTVILILLSLQSFVNLSLSQNCPPLLSILLLTSPVPHAHLNWIKPPQLRFSNVFWFENSKLSATNQVLPSEELSQPPHSSYLYHLNYV